MTLREEETFASIYNIAGDKFTKLGMDLIDEKVTDPDEILIGAAAIGKAMVIVGSMFISNSFRVLDSKVCLNAAKDYLKSLTDICRENHGFNEND